MKWTRIIVLGAVLAVGVLLVGVLAADTTLEAQGKVNSKITIDVNPESWTFQSDPDVDNTQTVSITVSSNKAWTVAAEDNLDGGKPNKGYMVLYDGSSYGSVKLTNPLYIQNSGGSYASLELYQTVCTGSKGKDIVTSKTLKQTTAYTDDPTTEDDYYRMIVTFTASQSS